MKKEKFNLSEEARDILEAGMSCAMKIYTDTLWSLGVACPMFYEVYGKSNKYTDTACNLFIPFIRSFGNIMIVDYPNFVNDVSKMTPLELKNLDIYSYFMNRFLDRQSTLRSILNRLRNDGPLNESLIVDTIEGSYDYRQPRSVDRRSYYDDTRLTETNVDADKIFFEDELFRLRYCLSTFLTQVDIDEIKGSYENLANRVDNFYGRKNVCYKSFNNNSREYAYNATSILNDANVLWLEIFKKAQPCDAPHPRTYIELVEYLRLLRQQKENYNAHWDEHYIDKYMDMLDTVLKVALENNKPRISEKFDEGMDR